MDTMTMKLKMLSRSTLIGATVGLVLVAQTVDAQQVTSGTHVHAATLAPRPLPDALTRYKAPLFELTEPGEKNYDAGFARQLRSLVAPQVAKNAKFLARLTSGPTEAGTYIASGQRAYIHYGICQAHQCDNTTMDILFDPSRKRMVGKLLDNCAPQWLGQPDNAEMALLDQRHRATFPATVTACAGEK
jgi:hypothetical protein